MAKGRYTKAGTEHPHEKYQMILGWTVKLEPTTQPALETDIHDIWKIAKRVVSTEELQAFSLMTP